jgi:proline iminopeptidase
MISLERDRCAASAGRCLRTSMYAIVATAVVLGAHRLSAQSGVNAGGLDSGAHQATLNGVRLWYRVAGNRSSLLPPVVFLHGGPGYNSYSFSVLEGPQLETSLRMVYVDQRGSGRSERPANGDYSMPTLVADIEALRRALGVEQLNIVAHSFGTILALEYAAAHPAQVAHLVIVSGTGDFPLTCHFRYAQLLALHPEVATAAAAAAKQGPTGECEAEFRTLHGPMYEAFANAIMFPDSTRRKLQDSIDAASGLKNTGEMQRAVFANGLLTYQFTAASRLTMPVLIMAGGRDGADGPGPSRALSQSIVGSRLLVYENAGHFVYLDEPARFARDVIAFISK